MSSTYTKIFSFNFYCNCRSKYRKKRKNNVLSSTYRLLSNVNKIHFFRRTGKIKFKEIRNTREFTCLLYFIWIIRSKLRLHFWRAEWNKIGTLLFTKSGKLLQPTKSFPLIKINHILSEMQIFMKMKRNAFFGWITIFTIYLEYDKKKWLTQYTRCIISIPWKLRYNKILSLLLEYKWSINEFSLKRKK